MKWIKLSPSYQYADVSCKFRVAAFYVSTYAKLSVPI